jgi:putative spermidine/putrescine transport system substrate-binding protein
MAKLGISAILTTTAVLATVGCSGSAGAPDAGKVVVANWGGDTSDAQQKAFFGPFTEETGIEVVVDTEPLPAKVKAQVDTGNVEWDVVVSGLDYVEQLNSEGEYYDPIPWEELDAEKVEALSDAAKTDYAVGAYYFAWLVASRPEAFPSGEAPKTFKEFFDVEKFPGVRTMVNTPVGMLEAALRGEDVPADQLYPLDTELAYAALDRVKPEIPKFFNMPSEAVQLLSTGQVDTAITSTGALLPLERNGVEIEFGFEDAVLGLDMWSLVHDSPNRDNAVKLLDWLIDPERQAAYSALTLSGPSSTAAFEYMDDETAAKIVSTPENLDRLPVYDAVWWAPRQQELRDDYAAWLQE